MGSYDLRGAPLLNSSESARAFQRISEKGAESGGDLGREMIACNTPALQE